MKKQVLNSLLALFLLAGALPLSANAQGEKEFLGTLFGIGGGALLGNQIGGGRGKTIATIGGAVVGGIVGNKIGRRLDRMDRIEQHHFSEAFREANFALHSTLNGPMRMWKGWSYRAQGYYATGEFKAVKKGFHFYDSVPCKRYVFSSNFNGDIDEGMGISCLYKNKWRPIDRAQNFVAPRAHRY